MSAPACRPNDGERGVALTCLCGVRLQVERLASELCGIPLADVPLVLRLLKEMGALLWYEEPGLRRTVILNPQVPLVLSRTAAQDQFIFCGCTEPHNPITTAGFPSAPRLHRQMEH